MSKRLTLLLGALVAFPLFFHVYGQSECSGGRYLEEIFPGYDLTSDIQYGNNQDLNGTSTDLFLDVYEPQGDVEPLRPLIMWAHGGTFITGTKDGPDVKPLAEAFSKMGYVCVNYSYRLGMAGLPFPGPDSVDATQAVVRGVQDAKAAVRWVYKSVANGNPYRIDTSRILMGGVSAGAFIAMHYVYLDDINELPSWIDTTDSGLGGGLEGLSGNPGFPTKVHGVINICGAIADTSWMETGHGPIVSLHGTADQVVPYGTDVITIVIYDILQVHGSASIYAQAQNLGIDNCFYTYVGAPHTPHVGNAAYTDTTINVIKNSIVEWVCGDFGSCGYLATGTADVLDAGEFLAFPNPAIGEVEIALPKALTGKWTLNLMNAMGQNLKHIDGKGNQAMVIEREGIPAGIYFMYLNSEQGNLITKVVFQ